MDAEKNTSIYDETFQQNKIREKLPSSLKRTSRKKPTVNIILNYEKLMLSH